MRRSTTVTTQTEVSADITAELYALYLTSFAHLEQLAAARHLLHADEFTDMVEDRRILKYIAWDTEGSPIGLCTVAGNLDAVPWVSPGFYAHRFPEHYARGAIHYVGVMLVHPSAQGAGAFKQMARMIASAAAEVGAVLAWDLCESNQSAGVHRLFSTMLTTLTGATSSEVDRQIYFGAVVEQGSFTSDARPAEPAAQAGS